MYIISSSRSKNTLFLKIYKILWKNISAYIIIISVKNQEFWIIEITFSYFSIFVKIPRPKQLVEEKIYGAYSLRVQFHDHHGREHGSWQTGMVQEQQLRASIYLAHKQEWGGGQTGNDIECAFGISKPTPCHTLPLTRPYS